MAPLAETRENVNFKKPICSKESWLAEEIIPDSEEERRYISFGCSASQIPGVRQLSDYPEVIEISSDEDEDVIVPKAPANKFHPPTVNASKKDLSSDENLKSGFGAIRQAHPQRKTYRTQFIVWSSCSEDDNPIKHEVAGLSSNTSLELPDSRKPVQSKKPIYIDSSEDDDIWNDNSGILVLDEPKSARRPVLKVTRTLEGSSSILPVHARLPDNSKVNSPKSPFLSRTPDNPVTSSVPISITKTPRTTKAAETRHGKKATIAAERKRLEVHAQQLFTNLNRTVFKNGLPSTTKLNWNKRLLTTAGRARWHRSRDGVQTTEIELAVKILDCEERIRNTLAHEMCHLATWVIDGNPKEAHGALFKAWAKKLMRQHPDIEVTTRHHYEISHRFQWRCDQCGKVYGRHTKSINPETHACGVCRGVLVPLFQQKVPRTPTAKTSQMASAQPRDSPCFIPCRPGSKESCGGGTTSWPRPEDSDDDLYDSDSDHDVELLSKGLGSIALEES